MLTLKVTYNIIHQFHKSMHNSIMLLSLIKPYTISSLLEKHGGCVDFCGLVLITMNSLNSFLTNNKKKSYSTFKGTIILKKILTQLGIANFIC